MATGPKKGLNPSRQVGSGVDNKGLNSYPIASGYGTQLSVGDPVKLSAGNLVIATNDTANAIGVFLGVNFTDSQGEIKYNRIWPASQVATNVDALVMDSPSATFSAVGDGPIPNVLPGDIYAMTLTAGDASIGRSNAVVKVLAEVTGDVDIDGSVDLPGDTAITANDTMTVKTGAAGASAVTITFVASYDTVTLLADLNAIANISASIDASGFLVIQATDGESLIIAEGTGTPFADLFAGAAGTFTEVVAASAGMVKVIKVVDASSYSLEVVLVDHSLRDNG